MWDGVNPSTVAIFAVVAIVVGAGLGFLRRSKTRTVLISIWTTVPFIIVGWAVIVTSFDIGSVDVAMSFGFAAVFTLLLLPPWALMTLLPFNLVRRLREIQRWDL